MDLGSILQIEHIGDDLARVEAALKESVATEDPFLTDVATHLIGAGGKRLRPVLVMACAAAVDGYRTKCTDDAITGAVAVELVHLGSLYHDDVIDEAETRRGVQSVNARWNNVIAILAGDFLLARASENAARLGTEVAGLLAATIGELCGGQVLELRHAFNVDRDLPAYEGAIDGKTSALMATSCRIGALVAGHDRPVVDGLTQFGRQLGALFQIVDDLLDVTATDEQLGKPAGQDLVEGIYTLPVLYALEESAELRDILGQPLDADQREQARALVHETDGVERATARAQETADAAARTIQSLDGLDAELVDSLTRLTGSLVDRGS
ncbi:MAG TPA: polyprenyl synthetase family protein [Acidimicrobiia bacterium]|nr:polyprenyl synthetase family protein [Acidimicrobiia bacterium]